MRVLVTGCGGFLGSEIVRQLIGRGDQVVGVSRGDYPKLAALGMIPVRGDLAERDFVRSAIRDIDAVVHTAAVAGVWGPASYYERNNKVATDHVIEACQGSGIGSLVFTSSPSVTFSGDHQRNVDEREPYPDHWLCHYPRTKALAEQAVLAADKPGGLRTVSLRPHLIWGNGDPHLLPRIVARAKSGRLRIVGDGTNRVDTVHVVNAAAAHLDALDTLTQSTNQAAGRAYFIAQDEPVNCWDWIAQICQIAGVAPPNKKISFSAAFRLGSVLEAAYRITGRKSEPPMTRFVAAQLAKDHYFDISAAKERLGYRVRVSMAEGLDQLRGEFF
ncbi:3 beta-hydroxysteroid dehydrogenase/Delta 5--_4-isomerase [Rubripirellula obstinata]|uniref:3 beta-hydroxysteroid dehydrogenase/Delta 5-->4-isomerase n=1 Tax=Rubripirellula obstinata TaxID=406547 RepID=A0A5B1CDS9_9BACT|nr:NAD-dependent epimerase/dehydratase family protein [Rubripirellula obstinata]KAA1257929.1 3 beta-hydroxysteroid dehydrogenase/Delta 5-->4-isomerase [Rubripirellula obstinata]